MRKSQDLRRSQFILTYGPGSIIESENGPRIIRLIDQGLPLFGADLLKKQEIENVNIDYILDESGNTKSKIFEFPTDSYYSQNLDREGVYSTLPFPQWKICYNNKGKHNDPVIFRGEYCPSCREPSNTYVRFVAACTNGHLDDVDWNMAVHGEEYNGKIVPSNKNCSSNYFYWKVKGSSFSNIIIQCPNPKCKSKITLGKIYSAKFDCTGRQPEKENYENCFSRDREYNCSESMKVLQRQSTALRIPETLTFVKIPSYENEFSEFIKNSKDIIDMALDFKPNEDEFLSSFKKRLNPPMHLFEKLEKKVKNKGIENFAKYIANIDLKRDIHDVLEEEFEALMGEPENSENFKKRPYITKKFPFFETDHELKIFPIDILKTVTVQKGYRRLPYLKENSSSKLVTSSVKDLYSNDIHWYPGFESIGEGIFVTADFNPLNYANEKTVEKWMNRLETNETNEWQGNPIGWRDGKVKNPQFVWWHTLSHLVMRTISLNSGYSSTSLRERVYMDSNAERGGFLIYAAFAGEDGGMGGLVESAEYFDEILSRAWKSLSFCSNDPLCYKLDIIEDRVNGAACHSCLMTSETSCEHSNKWLDRHILLKNDFNE